LRPCLARTVCAISSRSVRRTSPKRSSKALNAWLCVEALTLSAMASRVRNALKSAAVGSPVAPVCRSAGRTPGTAPSHGGKSSRCCGHSGAAG
jgi:hypothetical protein